MKETEQRNREMDWWFDYRPEYGMIWQYEKIDIITSRPVARWRTKGGFFMAILTQNKK